MRLRRHFRQANLCLGSRGTGRFRLTFDAQGNVTDIRIVTSTGNPYFDQAAIKTLRQWKSAPSQGWQATVPVTFQNKMIKAQTAASWVSSEIRLGGGCAPDRHSAFRRSRRAEQKLCRACGVSALR